MRRHPPGGFEYGGPPEAHMPTHKPRIAVTLSPEAHAALKRFTAVTGMAASSFVAGMVEDAIPVIVATAEAITHAKTSPKAAAEKMNGVMTKVVGEVVSAQMDFERAANKKRLRRTTLK